MPDYVSDKFYTFAFHTAFKQLNVEVMVASYSQGLQSIKVMQSSLDKLRQEKWVIDSRTTQSNFTSIEKLRSDNNAQ